MNEIEALYQRMLMSRSGTERVRMGADMYSAARLIVLAAKPAGCSEEEWILRRFHRDDFSEEEITSILNRIRKDRGVGED